MSRTHKLQTFDWDAIRSPIERQARGGKPAEAVGGFNDLPQWQRRDKQ